jgi:hypothetical protein
MGFFKKMSFGGLVMPLGVLAETLKCAIKLIAAVPLEDVAWLLCQSQGRLDEGGGWLMTSDWMSACKATRTCTHMHTQAGARACTNPCQWVHQRLIFCLEKEMRALDKGGGGLTHTVLTHTGTRDTGKLHCPNSSRYRTYAHGVSRPKDPPHRHQQHT